jgi:hypothetical protein
MRCRSGRRHWCRGITRHGYPRGEERALVQLVLYRQADRNRLETLKPGGGFEVSTLLATVQRDSAFRTWRVETCPRRQGRRATVAARRGDCLHQPWKAWSGNIKRGFGTLGIGFERPVPVTITVAIAVGVVIAVLTILAIAVHVFRREPPVGENCFNDVMKKARRLSGMTKGIDKESVAGQTQAGKPKHRLRIRRPRTTTTYLPRNGLAPHSKSFGY